MRILHVSPRYLPAVGGAEKQLHEISRRLAGAGHSVQVWTSDALDPDAFWNPQARRIAAWEEWIDGVEVLRFPLHYFPASIRSYRAIRRGLALLSTLNAPSSLLARLARFAPYLPALEDALARSAARYDLIGGMNIAYESPLVAARALAARQQVPWVVYPLTHLGGRSDARVRRFYTMRHQVELLRAADAVFAETEGERAFLAAQGLPADRLIGLGGGVNPDELAGGDAGRARARWNLVGPVVLFLGTVSADKGALVLLEAMKQLWAVGDKNSTLVLAGHPLEWPRGLSVESESVRSRLRVTGPISDEEKRDLLAACDLLALPSRVDSFGIVLLEAWLYGKPVVGAAAGGIPYVISDGQDGLLVPFGDSRALAAAVRRLLDNPDLAAEMGRRGCARVLAEHTWDEKFKTVRAVYARLADRGAGVG